MAPGQEHLARTAAALVLETERMAARVVNGEAVDPDSTARLVTVLHATLREMGLPTGPTPSSASARREDPHHLNAGPE
jgi:hypothetical protein